MDEVAAAAAVVAMSIDDDGMAMDDLGVEDPPVAAVTNNVKTNASGATSEDKENAGDLPVLQKQPRRRRRRARPRRRRHARRRRRRPRRLSASGVWRRRTER